VSASLRFAPRGKCRARSQHDDPDTDGCDGPNRCAEEERSHPCANKVKWPLPISFVMRCSYHALIGISSPSGICTLGAFFQRDRYPSTTATASGTAPANMNTRSPGIRIHSNVRANGVAV
jgi:hypothetical protein